VKKNPQIVVPVMDVLVEFPGASSEEVENWLLRRWRFCSQTN